MCGIVGYVGPREAVPLVLEALRRLEYRGYDSAGIAVHAGDRLEVLRAAGKLINLVEKAYAAGIRSNLALGHTRWATHGAPIEKNAHPHTDSDGRVAVVHNGIIENYRELKAELEADGAHFSSDTDSEVIAHLLARSGAGLARAALAVRGRLHGQYAVAAMSRDAAGTLVALRNGPPLVVGLGDGENLIASDPAAVIALTRRCIHLEDGDVAVVTASRVEVFDQGGRPVERAGGHPRLGARPGRAGRLPPLHAQGDPRAAWGGGRDAGGAAPARASGSSRSPTTASMPPAWPRSPGSSSSPAAPRGTPPTSASSTSSASPASRARSTTPRSSVTASHSSAPTRWPSASPSRGKPPTPSPRCVKRGSSAPSWRRCATCAARWPPAWPTRRC